MAESRSISATQPFMTSYTGDERRRPKRMWLWIGVPILVLIALMSNPRYLFQTTPDHWIPVAIDTGLRVPSAALFFQPQPPLLQLGDRVTALRIPPAATAVPVQRRREIVDLLAPLAPGTAIELYVERLDGSRIQVHTNVESSSPFARMVERWPFVVAGLVWVFFALICLMGSGHPMARATYMFSIMLGFSTLGCFDLVMASEPGWIQSSEFRWRIAYFAWMLAPSATLHFAMRFPVVHPRLKKRSLLILLYVPAYLVAVYTQFRFHDIPLIHAFERGALVLMLFAIAVLLFSGLVRMRKLKPIERFRTRALIAGAIVASAAPIAMSLTATFSQYTTMWLALCSVGMPIAIGWTMVRYQLFDPNPAFREGLLSFTTALIAFLTSSVVLAGLLPGISDGEITFAAQAPLIALSTIVLYSVLRWGFRLAMRGGSSTSDNQILTVAVRQFTLAKHPDEITEMLIHLIKDRLHPFDVAVVDIENTDTASLTPLARNGLEVWKRQTAPPRIVVSRRDEDPDPDQPEVVIPICPCGDTSKIVVVAARANGLPYYNNELRGLETIGQLASVAIGHALNESDLQHRVEERTATLERLLDDRKTMLEHVQRIQTADNTRGVVLAMERFFRVLRTRARLVADPPEPDDASFVVSLDLPEKRRHFLCEGLDRDRVRELQPQLDTVAAFANLALSRVRLVEELRQEVTRLARDVANHTAQRRHAEFVRDVADELRKPNEEVQSITSKLMPQLTDSARAKVGRVREISQEMNRRIDLLLYHSGLRFDDRHIELVRLIDDALQRIRVSHPNRDYTIENEFERLPLVGDPSRLLSVIENLLDNAAKATLDGGKIIVRSGLRRNDDGIPMIHLEVEDNGPGIPSHRQLEIFEPGVTYGGSGFGLGLALAREVIRHHDGDIEIESRPGRTIFRAIWPQFPDQGPSSP